MGDGAEGANRLAWQESQNGCLGNAHCEGECLSFVFRERDGLLEKYETVGNSCAIEL